MSNLICICVMWKGWWYLNANVSASSIFKNGQFFLSTTFCVTEVSRTRDSVTQDVLRTPIWKYITKHITVVLFFGSYLITMVTSSVLVLQMCALNTKQLDFAYSFSFGETSQKHLKLTSAAWRPWDVFRRSI